MTDVNKKIKRYIFNAYLDQTIRNFLVTPMVGFIAGVGFTIFIVFINSLIEETNFNIKFEYWFVSIFVGFFWAVYVFINDFPIWKQIHIALQKFKKLPLEEQLKKIEAIEAQKALRKSQRKKG